MVTRQTDKIADAVRLLVAMGGYLTAPGLKSGLGVYDAIRKISARPPRSLTMMAEELTAAAEAAFTACRDAPNDADILFLQMVEIGLLSPREIAAQGMDPTACVAAMLAKLTDATDATGEMRRVEMRSLFTGITRPALARLLESREYAADLTPAYMADVLQTTHRIEGKIDNVSEKLDQLETQTRDTLDALALRFGEGEPEALSLADLRTFLIGKARDYKLLLARVGQLDDREGRIADLKARARAAISDLRLNEARQLLHEAREAQDEITLTELNRRAELIEAEAAIAFLENDVGEARRLLAAAADSFLPFDEDAALRRRLDYAGSMEAYGERFGGPATAEAETMARAALERLSEDRPEWGDAHNLIGTALLTRGRHADSAEAQELLAAAAQAFAEARRVRTGAARAASTDNLAITRLEQANRADVEKRKQLLDEAVSLSSEAINGLEEPREVARALNNFGNILQLAAETHHETLKLQMLEGAFNAFDAATRAFGALEDIHNMAGARFGVATTWVLQADATSDPGLRAKAIQDLRKAVYFYNENNLPQDAAMAAMSLGNALLRQALEVPEEAQSLLADAEQTHEAAAAYYADVRQPLAEAMAQQKLALTHEVAAATVFEREPRRRLESAMAALARVAEILDIDSGGEDDIGVVESIERISSKLDAMD